MGVIQKIILGAVGAVVSYVAVAYAKKLLEEKPLNDRVNEVKGKVVHLRDDLKLRASDAKSKVDVKFSEFSKKVDDIIKKDEKPPNDDDNGRGVE